MQNRLHSEDSAGRTFAVIFDKGDEPKQGLTSFAREHDACAAQFTAVGGFRRRYLAISIGVKADGSPEVHAHIVVGLPDGTTRGGHLLEAEVWPTLEVIVRDVPVHLRRVHDEETGLALIDPAASR